jgi:hypothetical protein
MKTRDLTPKQVASVPCPRCGVIARQRSLLHSGRKPNELHIDRKLHAAEAVIDLIRSKAAGLDKLLQSVKKLLEHAVVSKQDSPACQPTALGFLNYFSWVLVVPLGQQISSGAAAVPRKSMPTRLKRGQRTHFNRLVGSACAKIAVAT